MDFAYPWTLTHGHLVVLALAAAAAALAWRRTLYFLAQRPAR